MSKVDNGMVFEVWTLLSLVCECCKHMSRYMHDYCDFFKHDRDDRASFHCSII